MNVCSRYEKYTQHASKNNVLQLASWSELLQNMQVLIDYHQHQKKPTRIAEPARIVQKSHSIVTVAYTNGRVESFSYADYLTRQVNIRIVGVRK